MVEANSGSKFSSEPTLELNHGGKAMPRIGFGTSGIKNAEQIASAIRAGYRHIDTASFYKNEEFVGEAIQTCIAEGVVSREDLYVVTKIWHNQYEDPEAALRESLGKLQLDQVDLYLIHWPLNGMTEPLVPMHVLWPKMEALQQKGLTKAVGVSNFNVQLLADMLTYCTLKPACNQIEIHPKNARPELIRFLQDKGIVPVAYSPLGRLGQQLSVDKIIDDPLIVSLAEKYGKEPIQLVLNWGLCRGYCVIPRTSSAEHQVTNLASRDFEMSAEDVEQITQKLDCGQVIFSKPGNIPYNCFA